MYKKGISSPWMLISVNKKLFNNKYINIEYILFIFEKQFNKWRMERNIFYEYLWLL